MVPCTRCNVPLTADAVNTPAPTTCPSCHVVLRADVYPALYSGLRTGRQGEPLQSSREAGCYYHPDRRALRCCSSCGRFMCSVCDIKMGENHLCPICLEKGKTGEQILQLVDRRVCYDQIALMVAVLPIFMVWITIVSAPIAVFLTIRYWNAPTSILPRSKIRFVLAIILALLQIIGWVMVFAA